MAPSIDVTPNQVRSFRARRTHLVGPGAASLVAAAGDLMGAQAQVESCALYALSLRTAGRPSAEAVRAAILDDHELVRTWGQRDTLHLYDARDWPTVIAALPLWAQSGRRGGMPPEALLERAAAFFAGAGRPLVRSDLFDLIPDEYVAELTDHPGAGKDPRRFAATRIVWLLARAGHIGFGDRQGREQAYVHRDLWHEGLDWSARGAEEAAAEISRRYLATFGPATVQDIAHWVGARVGDCRSWMERLEGELVACRCEGKKGLHALKSDVEALHEPIAQWPTRLLPGYDTMLMAHRDKRWILPDPAEEPLVWKKAAVVAPTVIAEGQIVATWSHNTRSAEVDVEVQPLRGWRASLLPEVERDAAELAAHLGLSVGAVDVAP